MTLSPKTLTSIAPLARSTILVRTSLIALLLALISMAQTPNMIDFELGKSLQSSKVSLRTEKLDPYFESLESSVNAKSEYELVEDGEGDLVAMKLDSILNVQLELDLLVDPVGWLFILRVRAEPEPLHRGCNTVPANARQAETLSDIEQSSCFP